MGQKLAKSGGFRQDLAVPQGLGFGTGNDFRHLCLQREQPRLDLGKFDHDRSLFSLIGNMVKDVKGNRIPK